MDAQYELRRWREAAAELERLAVERGLGGAQAVARLRWMTEEYCVSLFAQDLRTAVPVSAKRLEQQRAAARAALSA